MDYDKIRLGSISELADCQYVKAGYTNNYGLISFYNAKQESIMTIQIMGGEPETAMLRWLNYLGLVVASDKQKEADKKNEEKLDAVNVKVHTEADVKEYWDGKTNASFPITGKQLKEIFRGTDQKRCDEVAALINKYSDKFEINTPERMAHFLGQIGAETGLKDLSENSYTSSGMLTSDKTRTLRNHNGQKVLKYCSLFEGKNSVGTGCPYPYCNKDMVVSKGNYYAVRLVYYATKKFMGTANLKVKSIMVDEYPNDHDFFNTVYACQLGNGGIDSGDGYRFRGRGFLQITGYVNYESKVQGCWDALYGKGSKNFLCRSATCDANLEAIANDLDFSMQISLVFWKAKNISNIAKDISEETIKTITYKINGAYIGLPNRKKYTTKAYEVLKE